MQKHQSSFSDNKVLTIHNTRQSND